MATWMAPHEPAVLGSWARYAQGYPTARPDASGRVEIFFADRLSPAI